jgi:DNA-binding GntR family transcriptional regulator
MTIDRKYNAQEIYDALREMIISLAIMPGSRVTETQLAEYFDVSRTPIRAALQRLETEGYVTVKSKQGCFIRNIDMIKISQYYDVRVVLENLVLAEIGNLKDISPLRDLAEQWSPDNSHFGLTVSDQLKSAEEEFHLQLARISRNPVLVNYITDINDQIRVVRKLGWPDAKSVTDTYEEHHRICSLLLHADLATAQFEMTNHIRKSQDLCSRITMHQLYGNRKAIRFD